MIVELGEGEHGGPFVWPDEVKDFEAWDRDMYKAGNDAQEQATDQKWQRDSKYGMLPRGDADKVREQAKALLEAKEEWRPTWVDLKAGRGLSTGRPRDDDNTK